MEGTAVGLNGAEPCRALRLSTRHSSLMPGTLHDADPTVQSQMLTSLPAGEMTQWATNLL